MNIAGRMTQRDRGSTEEGQRSGPLNAPPAPILEGPQRAPGAPAAQRITNEIVIGPCASNKDRRTVLKGVLV